MNKISNKNQILSLWKIMKTLYQYFGAVHSIKYWHTTNIFYLLKLIETNRFFACHIILLFCVSYFSFPSFVIFFLFAACKLISIDLDLMWMFQISYTYRYRLTTKVNQSKKKKITKNITTREEYKFPINVYVLTLICLAFFMFI